MIVSKSFQILVALFGHGVSRVQMTVNSMVQRELVLTPKVHVFTSEQSPNNRIQKFSNTGSFIRKWGSTGSDNGLFQNPQGVAVDPQGHVFVSDTGNHRIQKFSNTGGFIRTWNSTSSGGGTSSTLATSQSSSPNLSEKMIVPDIFS